MRRGGFIARIRAALSPAPEPRRRASGPAWTERAYSGAAVGRLTADFYPSSAGPNAEVSGAGTTLRNRSSDLVRNNPHARKGVRVLVGDLVGTGILPKPATASDAVNKRLAAAWDRWQWQTSPGSRIGVHGQVAKAVGGAAERGNAFLRKRWRRPADGYAVPLQLELLEADYLDTSQDTTLTGAGPALTQGVEFDPVGRKAAYFFYPAHPGESALAAFGSSVRVDARDVVHVHEELGERIGQVLGVPWTAAVIRTLREHGEFHTATMVRQKFAAAPIGVATGDDPTDEGFGPQINSETGDRITDGSVSDAFGNVVEKFEPGMVLYARNGKTFTFSSPPAAAGLREYDSEILHSAAAGMGTTYEALSGDLSGMSWTSYRAGRIPYNRWIRMGQALWLIPCVYQPIWDWFVEAAVLAGVVTPAEVAALGVDLYSVKWTPPRLESVDPAKDAAADLIEVLAGFASRTEKVAARGRDPIELDNEIRAERDRAADLDLVFSSDVAAKVAAAALAPQPADDSDEDETAPADEGTEGRGVRAVGER